MDYNDENRAIEEYREMFAEHIEKLMRETGNDFESTRFILESALDFALGDKQNTIYK